MQAIRVQGIRRVVRRDHEADVQREKAIEQAIQDHRVGNVRHVELVEADESMPARDALRDVVERLGRPLELVQFRMDAAHELVKMDPRLADHGHGGEERIHQEALAATDIAPQVDAARHWRAHQQLSQRVRALRLVVGPVLVEKLQPFGGALL